MVGQNFQVNSDTNIKYLGVYDSNSDGLEVATEVGLWKTNNVGMSGELLASATVPQGTAGYQGYLQEGGQFRFIDIPTTRLTPGITYALGALYIYPYSSDSYLLDANVYANTKFAPWIQYQSQTSNPATTLAMPFLNRAC